MILREPNSNNKPEQASKLIARAITILRVPRESEFQCSLRPTSVMVAPLNAYPIKADPNKADKALEG